MTERDRAALRGEASRVGRPFGLRRRRRGAERVHVAFVLVCLFAACTEAPGEGSAPVAAADFTVPEWTAESTWTVDPVPTRSVGVFSGAEEEQLHDVSAATLLPDGRVVVADRGTQSVRIFDASGRFLAHLGRSGDGPGEFREPTSVVVTDRSVVVWDARAYRSTRFTHDGVLEGITSVGLTELMRFVDPPLYPLDGRLLADGSLVFRLAEKSKDTPRGDHRTQGGVMTVSADGTEGAVLATFPDLTQISVTSPWGPWPIDPPMPVRTHLASQPGQERLCVADPETSSATCWDADGVETTFGWLVPDLPVERGDPEVRRWRERIVEDFGQKLDRDEIDKMLSQVPIPEVRPGFSRLHLDRAGNVWLERGPADDGVEYLVLDSGGALLGSVMLPEIDVLEIGDDYVLGVQRDELDVQYVRTFAVRKPDGA